LATQIHVVRQCLGYVQHVAATPQCPPALQVEASHPLDPWALLMSVSVATQSKRDKQKTATFKLNNLFFRIIKIFDNSTINL